MVGVLLGLLLRLTLAVPLDLYARLGIAATKVGLAEAGSLSNWSTWPAAEGGWLRHFVLATWWLGAVIGALLLWQRGSRASDLVGGIVAGAAAGLVASATLACLCPAFDTGPRLVLAALNQALGESRWRSAWYLWTPLWVLLAVLWWGFLGGVAAVALRCGGTAGMQVLGYAAAPLAWLLHSVGLRQAAAFVALPYE